MKNDLKIHILDKLNDIRILIEQGYVKAALEDLESYIEDIKVIENEK